MAMLVVLVALLGLAAPPGGCQGQAEDAGRTPQPPSPELALDGLPSFVTVRGGRFQLDGREWFMTGTNIYYLAQRAADVRGAAGGRAGAGAAPGRHQISSTLAVLGLCRQLRVGVLMGPVLVGTNSPPHCFQTRPLQAPAGTREEAERSIADAAALGLNVIRTWAFADGPEMWNAIQREPGQYNETILREGLDYTVRWGRGTVHVGG